MFQRNLVRFVEIPPEWLTDFSIPELRRRGKGLSAAPSGRPTLGGPERAPARPSAPALGGRQPPAARDAPRHAVRVTAGLLTVRRHAWGIRVPAASVRPGVPRSFPRGAGWRCLGAAGSAGGGASAPSRGVLP